MSPRAWVDRGGTFTDLVRPDGSLQKVLSSRCVVGDLVDSPCVIGTTVVTNALLERRGVPVLLLINRGFADLPRIGDMSRPSLFEPGRDWPPGLATEILEVGGEIGLDGQELEPLEASALEGLDWSRFGAVAIALRNSPCNPAHERALAARVPPGLHVALGHELSVGRGWLARVETALVDAAFTPLLRAAFSRDRLPPGSLAIRSDGGLCPAEALRAPDAVLSGPAGGALAVAEVARQAGFRRAVGLDVGGTSADVCRVEDGRVGRVEELRVEGQRIRRPALAVQTVAAGGGSILRNKGWTLTVGPDSAGAEPGPACYGRGGPPALTDAALLAGRVRAEAFHPPLVPSEIPAPAEHFLAVAVEQMAEAVRRVGAAAGVDLADHALVAFGGAGGQYACEVAARAGIATVLVHPAASGLSAWGMSLARPEERHRRALWAPLARWDLVEAAFSALPAGERRLHLRYAGTDTALEVEAADPAQAQARFEAAHRRLFGFSRALPLEVAEVESLVRGPPPAPPPRPRTEWTQGQDRWDLPTTSVFVPPGWSGRVIEGGILRLDGPPAAPVGAERSALGVAIWGRRLMGIAEEAGEVLRRLARSVNIRERLDFSCAIFDGEGHLVANAPHVPVHLGAMGETVRDLIRSRPEAQPGTHWLCNDPRAGGSHLPDLTVVSPVALADGAVIYAACRAHHVDVGGLTPGSMPPHSRRIEDEGVVWRHVPVAEASLEGLRDPLTVRADLEAQVASNLHSAARLAALDPAALRAWLGHLRAVAAEACAALVARLPEGEAADELDGVPLRLRLRRGGPGLIVDFSGTGGPHPGNLNAPRAVVRAAVLTALRCLLREEIPLNEGALDPVEIRIPSGSILDPPPGAAVVGGNVETSQRLVDLLLRATGAWAGSMGTMVNLTLGGEGWSFYETIGGGGGAGPEGPGLSGRQIHMTNTRATDPEVLESRLPLRVRRFALRRGSGGGGAFPGGEGLEREIEVRAPATAALLCAALGRRAPGLGGGDGAGAEAALLRGGRLEAWDGSPTRLEVGDRVRIRTPGGGGWSP